MQRLAIRWSCTKRWDQINDLWAHVGAFRFARPHHYPVGTEAIWAVLGDHTEAFPEEWLGFPVVAIIEGKP